jgi:hypothetical protein
MRNEHLEKAIIKLDNDMKAMNIARKYLSNVEEIDEVKESLNKKRQGLIDELQIGDTKAYEECREFAEKLLNLELNRDEQVELLDTIKDKYGRQMPDVSKSSKGLNAWLKALDFECKWIENEKTGWAILVITGFGFHQGNFKN